MIEFDKIYNEDCLQGMKRIADGAVDCIITDLPYGVLNEQRKAPIDREPSDDFKRRIIRAEHSPLRCLIFAFDFYDLPYYASVHLVRHVHAQPFVSTSRPDIVVHQRPRDEQHKTDPANIRLMLNAQEILHISRVRLCNRAEFVTRTAWLEAITTLRQTEPLLANACVATCIYRGLCPEFQSCGFCDKPAFNIARKRYVELLKEDF